MHLAGERVMNIYSSIKAENENYEEAKKKLSNYFNPKKSRHNEYVNSGKFNNLRMRK